jgi:hypothetical protein
LQVFHDGTDSHVVTTNGDLNLQVAGAGTINLGDQFGNTLLKVVDNADVKLYHGTTPSEKLATTATGVDVTGDAGQGATPPTLRITNTKADYGSSATTNVPHGAIEFYMSEGSGNYPAVGAAIKAINESIYAENHGLAFFTNSDTLTPTERLRITSDGKVGIGTDSPNALLDILATTNTIRLGRSTSSYSTIDSNSDAGSLSFNADAGNTAGGGSMTFNFAGSEAMRITSGGDVLVGVAANPAGSDTGIGLLSNGNFNQTKGSNMMNLYRGGVGSVVTFRQGTIGGSFTSVGTISVTGSATAYNTSSDYRLKENVTADWDATTRLKQLNPVRFNFIADADTTVDGFLAHEVQSVVPEAITGTHNEVDDDGNPVYQGIDQSKLVPLLVKTIQELEARIAALENA